MQLKKEREIGPELLRIMAMLMIIFSHISVHGNIEYAAPCFNGAVLSVLALGGKTGVNVFIVISGYYSVLSSPRLKKAVLLIAQTVFYDVVLYGVSCAVGANPFRPKYLFESFLPFLSGKGYWFITIYLLLYAMTPVINAGIRKLTQRQFLGLLALFLFTGTVMPHTYGMFFSMQDYAISVLVWFVVLYSIGAYLRLYPVRLFRHRGLSFLLLIITAVTMAAATVISYFRAPATGRLNRLIETVLRFLNDGSCFGPLAILFSVFALIAFRQLRFKANRFLYVTAGATFGVYLIHENPWIRDYIWNDIINMKRFADYSFFILDATVITLLIFIVCAAVDVLRKYALEKPFFGSALYKRSAGYIHQKTDRILKKLHL